MSTAMELHITDIEYAARQALASGYFEYLTFNKSADQAVRDAVVIITKGRELNMPPILSLQKLYAVKGQVMVAVEILVALAARSKVVTWGVVEENDEHCKYQVTRYDTPVPVSYTADFSMADAKRLNLIKTSWTDSHGKKHDDNQWVKQPKTMLRKRAASIAFREVVPDIVGGMYTFDELGVQTIMDPQDWTRETPVIGEEGLVVDPDVALPAEEEVDEPANGEFTAPMTPTELHQFSEDLKGLWAQLNVDKERRPGILADALKPFNVKAPGDLTHDQGTAILFAIRDSLAGVQPALGVE